LANSGGEDFIIGISCKEGIPVEVGGRRHRPGKPRIENLFRDAVEPRFTANIRELPLGSGFRVLTNPSDPSAAKLGFAANAAEIARPMLDAL
jgi:hypothetical protein